MSSPVPIHVTGGTGGLRANRDELVHLASEFTRAASALADDLLSVVSCGVTIEAGVFPDGPAALDPIGANHAHQLVNSALHAANSARSTAGDLGKKLVGAASGYPWGTEVVLGGGGFLDTLTGLAARIDADVRMPFELVIRRESYLTEHPELVDDAARTVLDDLEPGSRDADGIGVALAGGVLTGGAPRNLADLARSLDARNRTNVSGGIDVRITTTADGRRSVIVNITGTKDWNNGGRSVADLKTNVRAVMGRNSAYTQGVFAAMRRAGVRPDDPVMFVGHSQGGMVAVNAAGEAVRSGAYRVTHVITAGSPIGIGVRSVPRTVRVLALENTNDVVPHMDGDENPDRRNVVTVKGGRNSGTVAGNHSIGGSYVPIAEATDRSGNRSVRDFVSSGRKFFEGTTSTTHVYQVVRK